MHADSKPGALLAPVGRLIALAVLASASAATAEEGTQVADAPAAETIAQAPPPPTGQPEAPKVSASEPPASPVATTEPEPEHWTKRVKLEGFIDTFYSFNFAGLNREPSTLRVFDAGNSTFNVAYAEVALSVAAAPVGFRLDLGFGPVADLTSYDAADPLAPGISEVLKHFQQAYGSIAIGDSGWTVDAGKFVTTAGAELIEARSNWNYSRSILFGYAIPFTHTGLRVGGPVTSTLSLQASLVNGWEVVHDNNRFKTMGLSGTFAPPTGTTAILTLYGGPEGDTGSLWRNLVDLVVLQKIGEQFTVGVNGDYAVEGDANWYGAALMAEYKLTPAFRLAARAEHFADPDSARGVGTSVSEGTLTAALLVGANAEVRAELRGDTSADPLFGSGTALKQNQGTAQLAFLAWF